MHYVNRTHKPNLFQLLFVPAFLAIALSAQTAFANPVIHEIIPMDGTPDGRVWRIVGEQFTPVTEIVYKVPGKRWKHGPKFFLYANVKKYIDPNTIIVFLANYPRKDMTVDVELFDDGQSSNRVTVTLLGTHNGVCGDNVVQSGRGEYCDDGNTVNGDGCSDACLLEQPGVYECNDGINNNQRGGIDFGNDYYCRTPYDNTEHPVTNGKGSFVFDPEKGIPAEGAEILFKLKDGESPENYAGVIFSLWNFTQRKAEAYYASMGPEFKYYVTGATPDSDVQLRAMLLDNNGRPTETAYIATRINGPGEVHPGCSDGFDNDGNLLIDYPADPDCLSELDESEQEITGVFTGFDPQEGYTVGSEVDLVFDLGSNVSSGDYNIVFQVWHNDLQEVQAPHTDLFPAFIYLHDVLDTVTPGSVELQAIVRNNQTMAAEAIVKVTTEIHEEANSGGLVGPFTASELTSGAVHPNNLSYWDSPYFSDGLVQGKMLEYDIGFGTDIKTYNFPGLFENGYPKMLPPGKKLRIIPWGLHVNYGGRPAAWLRRDGLAEGLTLLLWKGNADVRITNPCTFNAAKSTVANTGSFVDGQRYYNCPGGNYTVEIHEINAPITDMNLWLPDPTDPQNKTLEGQLYHPTFLADITDRPWAYTRMKNFSRTDASPEQDWADRILPIANFYTGIKNDRSPGGGFQGDRSSGVPWEHIIELCNIAQTNCWINVPHLATDDYVQKLAKMIHHGGKANGDPFDPLIDNPNDLVYPPLDPHLRVFVEYSNEIWSNGNGYPQGQWAIDQAALQGITRMQFIARQFARFWRLFESEFSDNVDRIVRVAATHTANVWYTEKVFEELALLGEVPHVLAITTFYGNGIQDWAHETAVARVGTPEQMFYRPDSVSTEGYYSIDPNDSYWTSPQFAEDIDEAAKEWTKRLLSGARNAGGGPDATNIGGGFDGAALKAMLERVFGPQLAKLIAILAYEGGDSLYTHYIVQQWLNHPKRGEGVTTFLEAFMRTQNIVDVYRIHLEQAWAQGLRTHIAFTDVGKWGVYGFWGHKEFRDQPDHEAKKYSFILNWFDERNLVRHIDDALNSVPAFVTSPVLPIAFYGIPYSQVVEAAGGDGQLSIERIGEYSVNGLSLNDVPGHSYQKVISGIPMGESKNRTTYMYLRVLDEDGDPSYVIYSVPITGFPNDVVDYNLSGANLSRALPHTGTHFMRSGVSHGSNHGINIGSGMVPVDSNTGVGVKINNGTTVSDYAYAHSNNLYFDVKINVDPGHSLNLRNQEISFSVNSIEYSSPNRYAAQTNIEGFGANDPIIFDTGETNFDVRERSFVVHFPDSPLYENITGTFEMRIYAFGGQWNKQIDLTVLRIGGIL